MLRNIFTNCYNITAVSDFCFTSCCDVVSCKEQNSPAALLIICIMGDVCMVANNEQCLVKHIKDFNNDIAVLPYSG